MPLLHWTPETLMPPQKVQLGGHRVRWVATRSTRYAYPGEQEHFDSLPGTVRWLHGQGGGEEGGGGDTKTDVDCLNPECGHPESEHDPECSHQDCECTEFITEEMLAKVD